MNRVIVRSILIISAIILCSCDKNKELREKSEKTEFFYKVEGSENGAVEKDEFSTEPFEFVIRPERLKFVAPKNYLRNIGHQYQPYAKEIWDAAVMEFLLPNFEPRTKENYNEIKNNSERNKITVIIKHGGSGSDSTVKEYIQAIKEGKYILSPTDSTLDVSVYRKPAETTERKSYMAMPDPVKFASPIGDAMIIHCDTDDETQFKSMLGGCHIRVPLPNELSIEYYFSQKYLKKWPNIHSGVLNIYNEIEINSAPNKSLKVAP